MKRKFTLLQVFVITILLLQSYQSHAQNQVYWRESFTPTSTVTADPGLASTPYTYSGDAGIWTMYGVWQTTGTSCVAEGTVGSTNRHIRSTNAAIGGGTPADLEDDTAYMITPVVNYGIQELHLYRSRNNRRITIWKSPDISPGTTNWTLATVIPKSTLSPVTLCTDTTILINDANAKQIRFRFERAVNSDVDSIVLTSVAPIPMPVKFTGIQAIAKGSGVEVKWSTVEESNLSHYVVEYSTDGRNFKEKGIAAPGRQVESNNYSWFDATPAKGVNYYRVKSVDMDASAKFTSILKVTLGKAKADILVSPNPVVTAQTSIQLVELPQGSYSMLLYNAGGQIVQAKTIYHPGGSSISTIQFGKNILPGIYSMELTGGDTRIQKQIVFQ